MKDGNDTDFPALPAIPGKKSARAKAVRPGPTTTRAADYAIQGFIYQFNKTLLAILDSAEDAWVVAEGVIEDIDIHEPMVTKAIQCKYHETQETFVLSLVYKPILQMLDHFHSNSEENIEYRLFAHFPPKIWDGNYPLTAEQIEEIFATTSRELVSYTERLRGKVDIAKFLARFTFEFGPSMEQLIARIEAKLTACGFLLDDVPTLIYPNAFHIIAELCTRHDPADRRVVRAELLGRLHALKTTTISRWTLALRTAKDILHARRLQLKQNLARNVRRRSFLISETAASDLKEGVVVFMSDYLAKYHFKAAHTEPPMFCLDCDEPLFNEIRQRIHEKGIRFADGFIGSKFDVTHFARVPFVSPARDRPAREFSIRLLKYATDPKALSTPKCDDLFVISTKVYPELDLTDVNEERLSTATLAQVKYVLGVSDAYE